MKLSERLEAERDAWRGTKFGDDICELLDEAAELARRVEVAPVVEMPSRPGPALQGASLVIGAAAAERMRLAGQRVRLVPEDGQGEES